MHQRAVEALEFAPFHKKYAPLLNAMVFAVYDCGYERFRFQLGAQAREARLDHRELTFDDYTGLVVGWLSRNPWQIP